MIASEWRKMFLRDKREHIEEIVRNTAGPGYPLHHAEGFEGQWPERERDIFRKMLTKLHKWHARDRMLLFYGGAALVVVGFVLQVTGSWPKGVFGITGC